MTIKPTVLPDKHPLSAMRSTGTFAVKNPAGSPPGTYLVEVYEVLVDGVGATYLRATNLSHATQRLYVQSGHGLTEIPTGSGAGSGDMLAVRYDPEHKEGDAFDMDNMSEGKQGKVFTQAERDKLASIAAGADVTTAKAIAEAGAFLIPHHTADHVPEGEKHFFLTAEERGFIATLIRRAAASGENKDITSLVNANKIAGGDKTNVMLTIQQTTGNGNAGGIRFLVGNAGETEPLRFDVHGHLLAGATEAHAVGDVNAKFQLHGDMSLSQEEDNDNSAVMRFFKSRAKYAVYPHDQIGGLEFHSDRGDGVSHRDSEIVARADGSISLLTSPNKQTAPSESFNIDGTGAVMFPRIEKTAASGNAALDADNANSIRRSVSALSDMAKVETLESPWADVVMNMRPVWYESAHDAGKSFYGLVAEEVAALDERLVHWVYPDSAYDLVTEEHEESIPDMKTVKVKVDRIVEVDGKAILKTEVVDKEVPKMRRVPVVDENGKAVFAVDESNGKKVQAVASFPVMKLVKRNVIKRVLKEGAEMIPDGVMYDRLSVFLIHLARKQRKEIEALAKRVSKAEATMKSLSAPTEE
jgi:hypothetical protein